jgi:hypothetical protein
MSSGSSLTFKLYDEIIKMLSKSHETIPSKWVCALCSVHSLKWVKSTEITNIEFTQSIIPASVAEWLVGAILKAPCLPNA